MTKQLYEDALADVKKVKQVAEDNAKRAVLEAVTPRIREFIDRALLREYSSDEDPAAPGAAPMDGELLTDLVAVDPSAGIPVDNAGAAVTVVAPDAEGKLTLDLDALCSDGPGVPVPAPMFGAPPPVSDDDEYEINIESVLAFQPIVGGSNFKADLDRLVKEVRLFGQAGSAVRSTNKFREQIAQMISRVENMYVHVQEQVADPSSKHSFEQVLEATFKTLNKLQESTTMSKKTKMGQMNEADVTLKLSGLPDDIDLDTVGVDLITGEDEEGGDDLDAGDDAGMDDLDLGGDQGQDMEMGDQMETRKLSDDTIVEIDEKMLQREVNRLRRIRESHSATGGSETKAQSWGNGSGGSNILDDFGGGSDEGEPTDAEIVDKSPAPAALPLGEADEDLDEAQAAMDELDEKVPTNKESRQPGESMGAIRQENLKKLAFEKTLQERAQARASRLKNEATRAKGARLAQIKSEYALVAKRFNESLVRSKKMTQLVAEATQKLKEARSNSGAARPAETSAGNPALRKKLAETNLFNAKLLYTNKLLQNEQLTAAQKAQVIKQLDSAETIREAKMVYEGIVSTLQETSKKTVTESADRKILGSASRVTRPATTQTLNEGYESERWAQLAGITRR